MRKSQDVISGTAEHPFFIADHGWRPLAELARGDELIRYDGKIAIVWEVIETDRLETVYNFAVAGTHTFFVGADGVLVHNACYPTATKAIQAAGGAAAKSKLGPRATKAWDQIRDGFVNTWFIRDRAGTKWTVFHNPLTNRWRGAHPSSIQGTPPF